MKSAPNPDKIVQALSVSGAPQKRTGFLRRCAFFISRSKIPADSLFKVFCPFQREYFLKLALNKAIFFNTLQQGFEIHCCEISFRLNIFPFMGYQ